MRGTVRCVEAAASSHAGDRVVDQAQLLKGVLDLAVLAVLERQDSYGYDVVRRLRESGVGEVGEASVYGTLRRLFRAGLLTSYVVASDSGPHRKYYGLSVAGRRHVKRARDEWFHFSRALARLVSTENWEAS
jgi:PadR family transcriptional regulator PadR